MSPNLTCSSRVQTHLEDLNTSWEAPPVCCAGLFCVVFVHPTETKPGCYGNPWTALNARTRLLLAFISCNDPGQTIYTTCLSADLKCSSWSLLVMQCPMSSPPCHSFQLNSTWILKVAFKDVTAHGSKLRFASRLLADKEFPSSEIHAA